MTEKLEYKNYNIIIEQDDMDSNPREECENLGHMACFHNRYDLGDNYKTRPDYCNNEDHQDFIDWIEEHENEIAIILPLYLYDHSGITMWTDDGIQRYHQHMAWDGGQVGYIYVLKSELRKEYNVKHVTKKTLDLATKVLISEVQTFDQFITGDVWFYRIEDQDENVLDSCGGFFGYDYCFTEAKSIVDFYTKESIKKAWTKSMIEQEVIA